MAPNYLKDLMEELSVVDFLKITLMKMDEITIKTEEELLLLDKILYKTANVSKDFKMRLLTPQLQEKFQQRMKDIKLDHTNFINNLKAYEKGKGPYNKSKADIPLSLPPSLESAVPKPAQDVPHKALPEKKAVPASSEKRQLDYSCKTQRSVEKGGMTPKRRRSSSSSSSTTDSDEKEDLQDKISKLQKEIDRLNSVKGSEQREPEQSPRVSSKYSFKLKKPEQPAGRTVLMHANDASYFERSANKAPLEPRSERGDRAPEQREPRSERGDRAPELREPRSERGERDYRHDPEMYEGRKQSKWSEEKSYRSKTYQPPYPFKR